jgi:hypothetical protein
MHRLDIIISRKYKFVWVGIPKVATRSFIDALIRSPREDWECEQFKLTLEELANKVNLNDYFVFSFVRNPWARIASCYLNKIKDPSQRAIDVIISKYKDITPNMPFDLFVDFLVEHKNGSDLKGNSHWISQMYLLKNKEGDLIFDKVYKLEELNDALEELADLLKMPKIEISMLNTFRGWDTKQNINLQSKGKYKEMYNESTKALILKRYKEEIDFFNYTF